MRGSEDPEIESHAFSFKKLRYGYSSPHIEDRVMWAL